MNFKDPVTTFAYNLISLHHDVMWYVLIILCLVYWSLYKILKDYTWSMFNKQEGFLSVLYSSRILVNMQIYIFAIGFFFYKYLIIFVVQLINGIKLMLEEVVHDGKKGSKMVVFLNFFLGQQYFKNLSESQYDKWKGALTFDYMKDLLLERFLAYYLFSKTSNALYFYDRKETHIINLNVLGFKHSIRLEYIFGLFPTVIISLIIVPSMYLLYSNETDLDPNLTIKIIGHQWYWSYQSRSLNILKKTNKLIMLDYNYDSVIIDEKDLAIGAKRLLETDNCLVLPYNVVVRFLITSADVLHAWALPEFGIKVDAVPGRLNQVTVIPNNLGVFYGQCSELCGVSHGFMPIKVNVITIKDYYNLLLRKTK